MLSKIHISQKIRRFLDAPLRKKNILFWLFSPLFFLVSFIVFCVGLYRRKNSYANFQSVGIPIPERMLVICIGNILLGGSGKSPLVRKFASSFLKQNAIVGIAARGIGANSVVVDSKQASQNQIDQLSDENREHFELLRREFPDKHFFIFQNKNRLQSLRHFITSISANKNYDSIFLLDDGLQHFKCPRHINICVSDFQLTKQAPPFAWPVGPYREGFGQLSMKFLLQKFQISIWTHPSYSLQKNHFHPDILLKFRNNGRISEMFRSDFPRHILATYSLRFLKLIHEEQANFNFQEMKPQNIQFQFDDNIIMIAGIAHPERFFHQVKFTLNLFAVKTLALADHGYLTENDYEAIRTSNVIILTMKDFCRFCGNSKFLAVIFSRVVYICYPDYELWNVENNEI